MQEFLVHGDTLPEAYHKALYYLNAYGEIVPCPDYSTSRKEISMTIHITHPLQEPMISRFFVGGPYDLERYRQEMLDGIMDFEVDKGNWVYTYHSRMTEWMTEEETYNQINFIIEELRRNPFSTRAVIDVRNNAQDMYSDDPACLQHLQFFIRNNRLDCDVLFRSNDATEATFMNAFALIMLQKRIADALEIEVGTYTHRANSFHCYEKDFEKLKAFSKKVENAIIFIAPRRDSVENLAYYYKGDWEDMMEEEKPNIAKMVEKLKEEK